jgi:hypothetical protein
MGKKINVEGLGEFEIKGDTPTPEESRAIKATQDAQRAKKDTMPELAPGPAPSRPLMPNPFSREFWSGEKQPPTRLEDAATRVVSSLGFGLPERAAALIQTAQGKGTYGENVDRNVRETEAAGERLGPTGRIVSDVVGGALTGTALSRTPATIVGRLGPRAPLTYKALAGGAEGALYGAAEGAGHTYTGNLDDYVTNALKGGLVGSVTGAAIPLAIGGVQKLITPHPALDPTRAAMVRTLEQEGVNTISAGQRVGDPNLRMTEDAVAKLPFGRSPTVNPVTGEHQMEEATQAAMRHAGITGPRRLSSQVLDDGFNRVGGEIGRIQGQYPVRVDQTALNHAVGIMQDAQALLTQPGEIATATRFVDRLTNAQHLDPDVAGALRTQLNKAIDGAASSPNYQDILINIRNTLDEALERTITAAGNHADVTALNTARQQYANLNVLANARANSGASGARGVLTPTALYNAEKSSLGRVSVMRGRGDMTPLAEATAGVLEGLPESGTAWREGVANPAKAAVGAVLQPAINSRLMQGYLANQRMPNRFAGSDVVAPVAGAAGVVPGLLDDFWQRQGLPAPGGR